MDIGGLGTASLYNVGIGTSEIPILDASAKLPSVVIPNLAGDVYRHNRRDQCRGLQGRPISNVAPALNYILRWNGTEWAASADQAASQP